MPLRTINLKLSISRKEGGRSPAQDIWTTHAAVNIAVAEYESLLLEIRGATYRLKDGGEVAQADVTTLLDLRIKTACERNGRRSLLSGSELADNRGLLRQLYEAIVPSSIGSDGTAQQSNSYIGPLTDPESKGFLSIFDKIGAPPSWLKGVRNGEADAFATAILWARSHPGKMRLAGIGSPPTWVRKFRKEDADWPASFVADYDRKLEEAKGVPRIIRTLKERKVLPLATPCLAPHIVDVQSTLSPWDRLAFRLAVGHLLSWESWCQLAAREHAKRQDQLATFTTNHLDKPEHAVAVATVRRYESDRNEELSRIAFTPNYPFRITRRMVRGWSDLREKWLISKNKSPEHLIQISAMEQTRLRGKFGDPHLFKWLASRENHGLWDQTTDIVSIISAGNALASILKRSLPQAGLTLPDPLLHPRSVQWEAEGGTNLKKYKLSVTGDRIIATIPLLHSNNDGTFGEVLHSFPAASHGQLRHAVLGQHGKGVAITFQNQNNEIFTGKLKSADLLLDWQNLRHHTANDIGAGGIGSAWFKIVIDVAPQYPEGWDGKRPQGLIHFSSALGNNQRIKEIKAGLRVLSVDLGIRSFGTCSVFTLTDAEPHKGKLSYEVEGGFWAVHERSFVLRMPGEIQDIQGEEWRTSARDEVCALRRTLGRYRAYYRLTTKQSVNERETFIDGQLAEVDEWQGWPFEEQLLAGLRQQVGFPPDQWEASIAAALETFRRQFGLCVEAWRRTTRPRSIPKAMGNSVWAMKYLTEVRKFLISWSLLGRKSGDIRRLNRARRGVFASRLLAHMNGIQEDRLKTGADLIIQAARGYLRDEAGLWKKQYAPCHTILFEDLTRYRLKTDRPKRENSQMMLWAHRSVPKVVAMQGEIYGLYTAYTGAAFSSRYHAFSGTPGIRCRPIAAGDKENESLRAVIQQENPRIVWDKLKPGDLVPLSGGEIFVCLRREVSTTRVHTDINAAQNLQRRFWTRHADAFRLSCRPVVVSGEQRWVPRFLGKRLFGALGYGWLVPTGHESGSCRWESVSIRKWKSIGGELRDEDRVFDGLSTIEAASEEMLELSDEVLVFFRDPSGVVFPKFFWYPGKRFWGEVKTRTAAAVLRH